MTTRTKERTKVTTEKEEITEVKCVNCSDFHPENEIYPMTINQDYENNICEFCSDSMYDYSSETSKRYNAIKTLDNVNYKELWIKNTISFLILSGGISLFITSTILTLEMLSTPDSPFAAAMSSGISIEIMIIIGLFTFIMYKVAKDIS